MFPSNVRGAADGVATMSDRDANFIVSLIFPVISVLAFIFVRRRLPETKGKSLE